VAGIDWAAIYNASGLVGLAVVAIAAVMVYDARRPRPSDDNQIVKSLDKMGDELAKLRSEVTDRMGRTETRLEDHQRQLDRLDRREK
jgi:hypothetical protein